MYSPFDTICVGIGESKPSASSAGVHLVSCASLNHASSSRDPGALSGILTLLSVPHGCPRDRCASTSSFLGASALASAPGLDALQRVAQAALLAAEVPGLEWVRQGHTVGPYGRKSSVSIRVLPLRVLP